MREFLFPKRLFPSKLSILGYILFFVTLITLVMTIGVMPAMYEQLDKSYLQPKVLNSLALAGFLGGMGLYAIERGRHKSG